MNTKSVKIDKKAENDCPIFGNGKETRLLKISAMCHRALAKLWVDDFKKGYNPEEQIHTSENNELELETKVYNYQGDEYFFYVQGMYNKLAEQQIVKIFGIKDVSKEYERNLQWLGFVNEQFSLETFQNLAKYYRAMDELLEDVFGEELVTTTKDLTDEQEDFIADLLAEYSNEYEDEIASEIAEDSYKGQDDLRSEQYDRIEAYSISIGSQCEEQGIDSDVFWDMIHDYISPRSIFRKAQELRVEQGKDLLNPEVYFDKEGVEFYNKYQKEYFEELKEGVE